MSSKISRSKPLWHQPISRGQLNSQQCLDDPRQQIFHASKSGCKTVLAVNSAFRGPSQPLRQRVSACIRTQHGQGQAELVSPQSKSRARAAIEVRAWSAERTQNQKRAA